MASLKDIARASGYSIRTVNRVLKGNGYVGTQARERIEKTLEKLHYRPHRVARSLRTRRTREIAVCVRSIDELAMEKIRGLEKGLRDMDYSLTVLFYPGHDGVTDDAEMVETIMGHRPDGVALFGAAGHQPGGWVASRLAEERIPVVVLDMPAGSAGDGVVIDRPKGVYEAVRYLGEKGYRRIGYVGPRSRDRTRLDGYHRARSELKQPSRCFYPSAGCSPGLFGQGKKAAAVVAASRERPDAVQLYSDVMAMGFLAGLHECGIEVPGEIAVVGFDNRHCSSLSWPALTTVAQPNRETGEAAAHILVRRIEGSDVKEPAHRVIPTRLVIRESA